METVSIWYLTDYEGGRALSDALKSIGFDVNRVDSREFLSAKIDQDEPNLFVIDCQGLSVEKTISMIKSDSRLQNFQKFIIVQAEKTDEAIALSGNLLHIDFISRPFNSRELLILLEKSVLVEQYRNIMKTISRDTENRVESFESILHIHKNDMIDTKNEHEVFEKIVVFEKTMVAEQKKLNEAIRNFTALRQKELFDMKSRLRAEELLDAFRQSEMQDAFALIKAQQAVLDLSSKELGDAKNTLKAAEITGELGREEAIALHEKLNAERRRNDMLTQELEILKKKLS